MSVFAFYDNFYNLHGGVCGNLSGEGFGLFDSNVNYTYYSKTDEYISLNITNEEKLVINKSGRLDVFSEEDANGDFDTGVIDINNSLRIDGDEIITNTGTNLLLQHNNNGDLIVDSISFFVDASKNRVGIGTLSPRASLDVNGKATCATSFTVGYYSKKNRGLVVNNADSINWKLMELKNGDGAKLIVNGDGKVGIGVTSPEYNLDVCGDIRAKEVFIDEEWCDYVFDKDYNLPTLEEEKLHIEDKGHLLGFESEAEMGGKISLTDVTKRQQVKIEEMMLHIIKLGESLTELKAENTALKDKINDNN